MNPNLCIWDSVFIGIVFVFYFSLFSCVLLHGTIPEGKAVLTIFDRLTKSVRCPSKSVYILIQLLKKNIYLEMMELIFEGFEIGGSVHDVSENEWTQLSQLDLNFESITQIVDDYDCWSTNFFELSKFRINAY